MHTITNDTAHHREMLDDYFKALGKNGRVYVYGVDLKSIDMAELAASHNVEYIRRGPTIVKNFLETDRQVQAISTRKLVPETTSLLNGIPSTKEELEAMDKPSSAPEAWSAFRGSVEDQLNGHFSSRIESREQLFTELTTGTNDVVFLFAHFDGGSVYFGKEKVSIDELETLQSTRAPGGRPRVAVLVICNAGVLTTGERSIFRRQVKSVGEVLIKKGFFEKVIAPDHEIESAESVKVVSEYLSNSRTYQKGWVTLAEIEYPIDGPR